MQDKARDSGLWRALREDARCALIIRASEGRSLDADSIAKAVMRGYEPWPHVSQLTEQLRACVKEMLRAPAPRPARRVG
jgi:hypothetical protein